MTFDAREARSRAVEIYQPFEFIGYDGESYELPHAKMIDPAATAKMQSDDPAVREQAIAEMAPEAWAALQLMEPGVMVMALEAWQEHSGLSEDDEQGKEQPRSSAPNRAARRSKPTSRSGASTSTRSRSGKSKAASGSS